MTGGLLAAILAIALAFVALIVAAIGIGRASSRAASGGMMNRFGESESYRMGVRTGARAMIAIVADAFPAAAQQHGKLCGCADCGLLRKMHQGAAALEGPPPGLPT